MKHLALIALAPLAACTTTTVPPTPQDGFWAALSSHCGKAYEGRLVSDDARDADWAAKRMIAHWAQCGPRVVAIHFHVEDADAPQGWNRSRTWLVTREIIENAARATTVRLTLKHDHRHADGEEDAVTQYGGTTELAAGSARGQDFPVDAQSITLFQREGLDASLTNVWRLEVDPEGERGGKFAYQLTRRNDPTRRFRVEFDASAEVDAPPPAWGW